MTSPSAQTTTVLVATSRLNRHARSLASCGDSSICLTRGRFWFLTQSRIGVKIARSKASGCKKVRIILVKTQTKADRIVWEKQGDNERAEHIAYRLKQIEVTSQTDACEMPWCFARAIADDLQLTPTEKVKQMSPVCAPCHTYLQNVARGMSCRSYVIF